MPRPKTKEELLHLSEANFAMLNELVDGLSEKEKHKEFPEGTLNRNIRDVLAHLHHWHLLFLDWYSVGMKGEKPDMPAKGFSWKTTPLLNKRIQVLYSEEPLEHVRAQVIGSYGAVRHIMTQHSNEELFEKKRYKWTGSTSLGAYLVSNTSSHYDWAIKLIKKATKQW